ncbi:MAG: hypothetical protein M1819_000889 [Sarea resinae]|nr:MAG: hypothetical protein M1819_000889 [Sarea resinae]
MSQEALLPSPSSPSSVARDQRRPRPLHISKSFSRLEPSSPSPLSRNRASTLQPGTIPEVMLPDKLPSSPENEQRAEHDDIFVKKDVDGEDGHAEDEPGSAGYHLRLSDRFEDLPIELMSLTDRFIDSLNAKVYPKPPSIDRLSDRFQEFYVRAASHISTHIMTLSSRQRREKSPAPSASSRSSSKTMALTTKDKQGSPRGHAPEQQMLTTTEIADRRRARKRLEHKRVGLEESVEKRACEGVYDRIWRHRSTQDEERDEKLRSRTAALSVVGIGLKELGIDVDSASGESGKEGLKEAEMRDYLAKAREGLIKMNDEKYPLGKLYHLTQAHKSIVETLSHFYPSSSSADEILPTLIYTLITTPPEGINVISNLLFIQRFRSVSKVDGEAAYCLTNLEAAITFLETVDLASLRADETLEGPPKSGNRPPTPRIERTEHDHHGQSSAGPISPAATTPAIATSINTHADTSLKPTSSSPASSSLFPTPSPPLHPRRLSNLLQPSSSPFSAAGDAIMDTADQSFKNISNTLENSYKFLFGRLKEQQVAGINGDGRTGVIVPKTLDDARKLVNPSRPTEDDETTSAASSIMERIEVQADGAEADFGDRHSNLKSERTRDRSVDSARSGGSGSKRVLSEEKVTTPTTPQATSPAPAPSNPAVESMRSLGNTLNPLNRFAGMNMMRGFGRSQSSSPAPGSAEKPKAQHTPDSSKPATEQSSEGIIGAPATPTVTIKASAPIQRFLDVENASELKIRDVDSLLADYKRLAATLKDAGAF